jgi:hypothetical protein
MADFWLMFYILRLSGCPSSLHESNQPPLAPFDLDLIPLQHLVEGGANVGTASSAFEDSQVDLGEVTVGPLPKVTSKHAPVLASYPSNDTSCSWSVLWRPLEYEC